MNRGGEIILQLESMNQLIDDLPRAFHRHFAVRRDARIFHKLERARMRIIPEETEASI